MAEQSADKQAQEYCAASGKTPVTIEEKVSGGPLAPKVARSLTCVDESKLVATNPAFGAKLYPTPRTRGALVIHVQPGSFAARVGLRTKDLVYEYDSHTIESAADLQSAVAQPGKPGEPVLVKWSREDVDMSGSSQY
jgi:S1-C subfamily serine protease